jgi:hypothetical protein
MSKWPGRLLWFLLGAAAVAGAGAVHAVYRIVDPTVYIHVRNSLDHRSRHVQVVGGRGTIDLGDVATECVLTQTLNLSDIGQGPAWLVVSTPGHEASYPLGILLDDNGPFERFVNLTPRGTVGFYYAPNVGGWCGFVREEPSAGADTVPDTASGSGGEDVPTPMGNNTR